MASSSPHPRLPSPCLTLISPHLVVIALFAVIKDRPGKKNLRVYFSLYVKWMHSTMTGKHGCRCVRSLISLLSSPFCCIQSGTPAHRMLALKFKTYLPSLVKPLEKPSKLYLEDTCLLRDFWCSQSDQDSPLPALLLLVHQQKWHTDKTLSNRNLHMKATFQSFTLCLRLVCGITTSHGYLSCPFINEITDPIAIGVAVTLNWWSVVSYLPSEWFSKRACSMLRLLLKARMQGYKERGNKKVTSFISSECIGVPYHSCLPLTAGIYQSAG